MTSIFGNHDNATSNTDDVISTDGNHDNLLGSNYGDIIPAQEIDDISQWLRWDVNNKLLSLFTGVFAYTLFISMATIVICKLFNLNFATTQASTDKPRESVCKTVFVFLICTLLMLIGGAAFTTAFNFTNYYVVVRMGHEPWEGILANSVFSITVAAMSIFGIFTMKYFGYLKNLYFIGISMVVSGLALMLGAQNFEMMCGALACLGIATSFLFAPIFMWGAEKVDRVTSLSAWVQNGFTLAEISFPFLVGISLDADPDAFIYWLCSLCFLFAAILFVGEALNRMRCFADPMMDRLADSLVYETDNFYDGDVY